MTSNLEQVVGQWRLSRIEVINWGTFCGYHAVEVSRRGLLITGGSGSGKSTLLDALAMVLTPPRNRHLNAAARSGTSTGEDRTAVSYIRGAWRHETDDTGEVTSSFLRPNVATWSGIMLRYENGEEQLREEGKRANTNNEPINLLVLFNLKSGSNTLEGLSSVYAFVRGDRNLREFEPFAVNGIDQRKLKSYLKGCGQAFREYSQFSALFCRHLGIAGPKTLELLHKTQAAKNFGSLDDLFRNFMLDKPRTFELAEEALEQFTALSQAYSGVVDQRRQMECLKPLVDLDKQNANAQQEVERLRALSESLPGYTEHLALDILRFEQEQLQRQTNRLSEIKKNAIAEQTFARQAFDQAQRALSDAGGWALETAEIQKLDYERRRNQVSENRKRLLIGLECAEVKEIPQTYEKWQDLQYSITHKAQEAKREQEENKEESYRSYGQVPQLQEKIKTLESELVYLRKRATNIPQNLHRIREDIANHLGLPSSEFPFVGELVSVVPQHAAWSGAIERLLNGTAKTLLVTAQKAKAVSRYIESRNLGVRFEFVCVPPEVEVPKRSVGKDSLLGKVAVKPHKSHQEYSAWINLHLRERFDYVCVASPEDLENHRFALTMGGQIKRGNRYVKDDRFDIGDKARWILGSDNDEKITLYTKQVKMLEVQLEKASKTAELLLEKARHVQDLHHSWQMLEKADWSNYDIKTAEKDLKNSVDFYDSLKAGSDKIEKASALRDESKMRLDAAEKAANKAILDFSENERQLHKAAQDINECQMRADGHAAPSAEQTVSFKELFSRIEANFDSSITRLYSASPRVASLIGGRQAEARTREQKTRDRIERTIREYRREWKLQSADFSEDFEERNSYLGIYNQIVAAGLPDYEARFLRVQHDFSQDQITVIASTIRNSFREVKEKLIPVNRSLSLSKYGASTYLQIKAKDNKSAQVTDFLSALKEITQGTWDENDISSAEERYLKTSAIVKRFGSHEAADESWKKACLDTRKHVSFIANEQDSDGEIVNVHSSDAGLSGGQKQKLVIFCLAAALRYQLADEDQPIARFGTVVLDEAFDKADPSFTRTAMDIFEVFGFHMVLATPYKLISVLEPYIGAIVTTHCQDSQFSTVTLVELEEDEDANRIEIVNGE